MSDTPEARAAMEIASAYVSAMRTVLGTQENIRTEPLARIILRANAEHYLDNLRAVSECLRGHVLGLNCRGPALPDEVVSWLKSEIARLEKGTAVD